MTQRNNSALDRWDKSEQRPLSKKRFASTLPAQSISLLGSLSLLSSGGLVFAQTESAVDNLVPTIETPQAAPNPVRRSRLEKIQVRPHQKHLESNRNFLNAELDSDKDYLGQNLLTPQLLSDNPNLKMFPNL